MIDVWGLSASKAARYLQTGLIESELAPSASEEEPDQELFSSSSSPEIILPPYQARKWPSAWGLGLNSLPEEPLAEFQRSGMEGAVTQLSRERLLELAANSRDLSEADREKVRRSEFVHSV